MARGLLILMLVSLTLTGCRTENLASKVPVVDEFTAPPNDPRFTTPPMADYKKPPPKKAWGATPGNMATPMNTGGGGNGGNPGQ